MKSITPQKVTVMVFALLLAGIFVIQLVKPDASISFSERRKLQERPEATSESIANGDYFETLETYLLDQALFRDAFRTIKATSSRYLLFRRDTNGIYSYRLGLYKIETTDKESFLKASEKIESLASELTGLNCYYSLIPDKNALVAEHSGRPSHDISQCETLLASGIHSA